MQNIDNKLETFRIVCDEIAEERSYNNKSKILQIFLQKGINKKQFQGDTLLWIQMLVPGASQRVYNLQNKQMLKLFSSLFAFEHQQMQEQLEKDGDVSVTLCKFFEESKKLKPQKSSALYLHDVEEILCKLEQRTKENEQSELLKQLCQRATVLDLRTVIRLIKQDLRINAGARHILDALSPDAYKVYQATRDLAVVVSLFGTHNSNNVLSLDRKLKEKEKTKVGQIQVMTPISPMLANACKSVEEAFKKSPGGIYGEIKYDGERVQIHKKSNNYKFFSRNLKPVIEHKVKRFKEYIPKAFPGVDEIILDSEIILVDTLSGELLPFGTLGVKKKKEFTHAEVCLFVFDCLLYNGKDITNLNFHDRRKILLQHIQPIKGFIQLSECHFLKTTNELAVMMAKVLKANLEGVVLKAPTGNYQPGKRGWLKMKKDYLFNGKMADTADLVVLGAWFGSGKKGGIFSIFLMGCYDKRDHLWKTVTKVHSGLDDETNDKIHKELIPLMERTGSNDTSDWLLCKNPLVPDYIAKNPQKMPVWEITGAEFTKSDTHTAEGISIRFPRISKLRADKTAMEANDLEYLQTMYNASKNDVNVELLMADCENSDSLEIDSKFNLQLKRNTRVDPINGRQSYNKQQFNEACSSQKMKREYSSDNDLDEAKLLETCSMSLKKFKYELYTENKTEQQNVSKQSTLEAETTTIRKKVKSETNVRVKTNSDNNLFSPYLAYFDENLNDKGTHIEKFKANGGIVCEKSNEANLAFYVSDKINIQMEYFRRNFQPSCRHLSIRWIDESLALKKCVDFPLHAVVLKGEN